MYFLFDVGIQFDQVDPNSDLTNFLGTTATEAHKSVGSSTFLTTPISSILSVSCLVVDRKGKGHFLEIS